MFTLASYVSTAPPSGPGLPTYPTHTSSYKLLLKLTYNFLPAHIFIHWLPVTLYICNRRLIILCCIKFLYLSTSTSWVGIPVYTRIHLSRNPPVSPYSLIWLQTKGLMLCLYSLLLLAISHLRVNLYFRPLPFRELQISP